MTSVAGICVGADSAAGIEVGVGGVICSVGGNSGADDAHPVKLMTTMIESKKMVVSLVFIVPLEKC
jgi:hypothetical protein